MKDYLKKSEANKVYTNKLINYTGLQQEIARFFLQIRSG